MKKAEKIKTKMLKKLDRFIEGGGLLILIYVVPFVVVVGGAFVFAWLISTSNLPDWFKFFLLK